MGKLGTLITFLVFIDLVFIVTGQMTLDSPSAIVANILTNPEQLKATSFWSLLVTGLSAITITGAVIVGIVTRNSDVIIFFPMAAGLILLSMEYLSIYVYLATINIVLANIIITPILIMSVFYGIEWARGKD